MGTGQSEHHVTRRLGQPEQQARQVGRHSLAEGSEEDDEGDNPQHVWPLEQRADVDEHAHANQEVGYEDGVTGELDAVHQGRHVGDIAVQYQSGGECAHDALHADGLAGSSRQEHDGQDEDELHDGIGVAAQEVARQDGYEPDAQGQKQDKLQNEQQPERDAGILAVRRRQGCQHEQGHEERQHA